MASQRVEISSVGVSPDHFIGGRRVASDRTFEVRSPLDWDWKLADVARGDALTADLAVTAAVEAFPGWAAMGPHGRSEVLHRLADLIDDAQYRRLQQEVQRELRAYVGPDGAVAFGAPAHIATARKH